MHRWIVTPMTALLLLRTPARTPVRDWCELQGAGRSRKQIWYDLIWVSSSTVQPHSRYILGQRVHEHLLPGIHGGGRGFQWCDGCTDRATEKMRLLRLWVNICKFLWILHPGEKRNKLKCLRNFVHEWSTLVWYLQVGFHVLSHIQGTMPPLYLMQMYSKCCYLHCSLILIDHVACESMQMLKTEICKKNTVLAQERVFKNNFFGAWRTLGTIPWLNFSLVNIKIPYTGLWERNRARQRLWQFEKEKPQSLVVSRYCRPLANLKWWILQ